jgi:hypothetical protein
MSTDAARHALYMSIAEAAYGTTPATPAMSRIRQTGTTLDLVKNTFQSSELHPDRQIRDFRHGIRSTVGDISFELSAKGVMPTILEAVLGGTWAADVLLNGTTRRSFTLLRHFADLAGATKPYFIFPGCEFNSLALTFAADGIVTGTVGVIGKDKTLSDTGIAGQVLGSAETTKPFDSFSGSILVGGVSVATVTELTLNFTNGIELRPVIGEETTQEPSIGLANVTGQLTAYHEDGDLAAAFRDESETSVAINVSDADGNDFTFTLPRITFSGANTDISGPGPLMDVLPFQALYDETETTTLKVERTEA